MMQILMSSEGAGFEATSLRAAACRHQLSRASEIMSDD
jgi:hypothetical protein